MTGFEVAYIRKMANSLFALLLISLLTAASAAQGAPKLSATLKQKLDTVPIGTVPADARARAYAKFLEAQRYYWLLGNSRRSRTQAAYQANVKNSREALIGAVEIDPYIAEAYTILSELAVSSPPNDLDEALELAGLALRVDKNNFGARKIAARVLTVRARLGGDLEQVEAAKAIDEWKFITTLDPRNAEAWAFLSLLYERTDKKPERIDALRKWVSAAQPVDTQFFQRVTEGRETLATENASMKLADALLDNGNSAEAMDILSQIISDDPTNEQAIEMMRESVTSAEGKHSETALNALRQVVQVNPGNVSLAAVLAEAYADGGKAAEGIKLLRDAAERTSDKSTAGAYYALLGDLHQRIGAHAEAMKVYEKALATRGADGAEPLTEDGKAFATQIFQRMLRSARSVGLDADVRPIIERARKVLGPDDDFADRELVSWYREGGKRQEALGAVKSLRAKNPGEENLARLEATLLTELGRVDEAVAGFRAYSVEKAKLRVPGRAGSSDGSTTVAIGASPTDEFSNLLFISQLYTQSSRSKDAIDAAHQALNAARGDERRQIARLTLASAQQMGGDHAGAETTLREILKESPGNPIALNNLGYFLLERNTKLDEALKMIQEAVSVDPTNPSYLDSLGWAYFKLGKLTEAEKFLKDAAKFDSLSSTIAEHLGDVYQKQGRTADAKRQWQRALELASERSDVDRIKGKLK